MGILTFGVKASLVMAVPEVIRGILECLDLLLPTLPGSEVEKSIIESRIDYLPSL